MGRGCTYIQQQIMKNVFKIVLYGISDLIVLGVLYYLNPLLLILGLVYVVFLFVLIVPTYQNIQSLKAIKQAETEDLDKALQLVNDKVDELTEIVESPQAPYQEHSETLPSESRSQLQSRINHNRKESMLVVYLSILEDLEKKKSHSEL